MIIQTPKHIRAQQMRALICSIDVNAPDNAQFVNEYRKAQAVGLLRSMDLQEYVARRRVDAGLHGGTAGLSAGARIT